MKSFLKHYRIKIHTLSPVFIGNGDKIGKKEYIYLPTDHKIIIPDLEIMYASLMKKRKANAYQEYMIKNSKDDLSVWLRQQGIFRREYEQWKKYEIDAGDIPLTGDQFRSAKAKEIACFIKDAYGYPYVPGSSIKGMFRTALLSWEIRRHPDQYKSLTENLRNNARKKGKRNSFLSKDTSELETMAFHEYRSEDSKTKTKLGDAVNDRLSGLHVSDSVPIPMDALTLCQKIDLTLNKKEKPLPILWETLRPGTDIFFEISIDTMIFPYDIENILEALSEFQNICYKYFYCQFQRGTQERNVVWLGGGTGFLSKTVLYSLFGREALQITDQVFRNTLDRKYDEHKHEKDVFLGVAPHVCKCTRYQGKLYDMGMGQIEVLEH